MVNIYSMHQWERMSNHRREQTIRHAYLENLEVWEAPDGSLAFATFQDMESYAEDTGDTEWVCKSQLYYSEFKNE